MAFFLSQNKTESKHAVLNEQINICESSRIQTKNFWGGAVKSEVDEWSSQCRKERNGGRNRDCPFNHKS